jgi:hypothetical protein
VWDVRNGWNLAGNGLKWRVQVKVSLFKTLVRRDVVILGVYAPKSEAPACTRSRPQGYIRAVPDKDVDDYAQVSGPTAQATRHQRKKEQGAESSTVVVRKRRNCSMLFHSSSDMNGAMAVTLSPQ